MASPKGVDGCAAARSPGAEPSQREASWPGRHEGEFRALEVRCVGGHGLDKVLRTPRCGKPREWVSPNGPRCDPSIPVDLGWFMGSVPRRGDAEESRLGRLRMEGAFTLAGPKLDWGTMVGVFWLVRLGMLRFLGKATLGALGLVPLPVTLQGAVVMLQLNVLGMKMVIPLGHLGDAGAKELYLGLE
ncbi:unnamed protein product, partial [Prunus brigantina]